MIDNKSIQRSLQLLDFYQGPVDGLFGPLTHASIQSALVKHLGVGTTKWLPARREIAYQQLMMHLMGIPVGTIDGVIGPLTRQAVVEWQDRLRDIPGNPTPPKPDTTVILPGDKPINRWPTQASVPQFYGPIGQNQVKVTPPYQLYLYDSRTKVKTISLHTKVAASAERVLNRVLSAYSSEEINKLRLNRYFGSLNVRKMKGGKSWSMHSWGIALDFDANYNQLRWGKDRASFAKAVYDPWWEAWESEGWVSLGRERNYDYMHVQAARF